jgi:glucosamine--fructose-6-phosphate aminotransferase (isomerizing)
MSQPLQVVHGPYLSDILDQPRALEETHRLLESPPALEALARRLIDGQYDRVVLTGMGSSYHGLHPLHLRLVETGVSAIMVESSELLYHQRRLLEGGTLLVLLSQSGRSAEIVRLLEETRGRLETIGITNTADSPLAREATTAVLTHAGEEATVSCKTHLAAQMAVAWLGAQLTGGGVEEARDALAATIPGTRDYLAAWPAHVEELGALLDGARAVFYFGRGPSLATVGAAGLITKEATHVPSEGMSGGAFRHGPMEILDGAVFVLGFAGDSRTRALNESLIADVRAAGGRGHLASEDASVPALRLPTVPEVARPVVELLPVEMITLALAALAGREAGTFRVGQKVTNTE